MKKLGQKGFTLIEGLLIVIVLSLITGVGYYVYQASTDKSSDKTPAAVQSKRTATKKATGSTYKDGPGADWRTYVNYDSGFSIQIPKNFTSPNGANCTKTNGSYRPAPGIVPTTVVEEDPDFFITEAYTYQVTQPTQGANGITNFAGCEKVESTPATVNDFNANGGSFENNAPQLMVIPVSVVTVKNQAEIAKQSKRLINENVSVTGLEKGKGDWKEVRLTCSTELCLNGSFQLRYYEKQHKLVYMEQGQSGKLQLTSGDGFYDSDIIDSFKLIN